MFVSDDAGASWKLINEDRNLRQRAFYYTRIYADPKDKDTVYVLNGVLQVHRRRQDLTQRSARRTATTTTCGSTRRSERMVAGNDGGANVSVNGGATWTEPGLPDRAVLPRVHHRRTFRITCAARSRTTRRPVSSAEANPGAAEASLPADLLRGRRRRERLHRRRIRTIPNIFYAGSHGGLLDALRPPHRTAAGHQRLSRSSRWATPRATSRNACSGPSRSCSRRWIRRRSTLRRSTCGSTTNEGQSWEKISPDLTRRDPKTLRRFGRSDHARPERRRDLLRPSSRSRRRAQDVNTIWTGSDDGLVSRHARRRQELGEGHAAGPAGLRAHQPDRRLAAPDAARRTWR